MHSHHIMHEHIKKKRKNNPPLSFFDRLVLVASFVYPFTGIPQVLQVFDGQCQGVSVASWLSFTIFSVLFLTYGIRHRVVPMIVTYLLWFFINGLVVVGAIRCGASLW